MLKPLFGLIYSMGKWVHKLTNLDIANRTADCLCCGKVRLVIKHIQKNGDIRYECSVKKRSKNLKIGIDVLLRYPLGEECYICGATERLCLDHIHTTKEIRGTLCKSCNVGLGSFRDNKFYLQRALEYLGE